MKDTSEISHPANHPSQDSLRAYAIGEVRIREAETIESHLMNCDTCRIALESAPDDELIELVRAAQPVGRVTQLRLVPGYEIVDELGRGGMGVVYRARQLELNREVALKMIARGTDARPEELIRFRTEAQAVAALHHRNIVQVFDVGEQDGQPYLAMELIRGGTLDHRLADGPMPPRVAAELLHALADAVNHAHQHGVIHRDLKPANILLEGGRLTGQSPMGQSTGTQSGAPQPKITDFGLAKRLDTSLGNTQTGVLVGTPSYMAPELTTGRTSESTEAVDIYALGAILYESLVGRPPFQGSTALDTLEQTRSSEPVRPSQLQPSVPRDLETICLKCLEKSPRRRYTSATALADDLDRYLQGKPIVARASSSWDRTLKWIKRKPSTAALIAVSVIAAISLLAGGTAYNLHLRSALSATEQARARADENFAKSFEAANRMLEQVGFSDLADIPEMEEIREQLLGDAVTLYEDLLSRQPNADAQSRRRYYTALMRLGTIQNLLGQTQQARETLTRAIRLQEAIRDEFPDEFEYTHDLAISLINLGIATSDRQQAVPHFRRAVDLLGPIVAEHPACRIDLAQALNNLGNYQDTEETERNYEAAIRLRRQLVDESPADPRHRKGLAQSLYNLALRYYRTDRLELAEPAFEESKALWEKLRDENRRLTTYQSSLAECYTSLGALFESTDRISDAESMMQQGIAIRELVAERFPKIPLRQQDLARGYNTYGALLLSQRRHDDAIVQVAKALAIAEQLEAEYGETRYQCFLAEALTILATAQSAAGRNAEATTHFQRAASLYDQVVNAEPDEPYYAIVAGVNCMNFSNLLRPTNPEDALRMNDRSVELLDAMLDKQPDRTDIQSYVYNAHGTRAQTLMALNHHAEAVIAWDRVIEFAPEAMRDVHRLERALTMARAGQHAEAVSSISDLVSRPKQTGVDLYNLACVYGLAAAAATNDETLPPSQRSETSDSYVLSALQLLNHDQASAYLQLPLVAEQLNADADLESVRSHAEFPKLLERLGLSCK